MTPRPGARGAPTTTAMTWVTVARDRVGATGAMTATVVVWCGLALTGLATRSLIAALGCSAVSLGVVGLGMRRYRAARGGLDLADPLVPLIGLSAFAYAVVPLLQVFDEGAFASLPGYLDLPPAQYGAAAILGSGGLLCLMLGASSRTGAAATVPTLPRPPSDSRTVLLVAIVFSVLGFSSVLLILFTAGALELPIADVLRGRIRGEVVATFSGRGYLTVGLVLLTLAVPLWGLWACARRSRVRFAICGAMLLTAMVALGGPIGSRLLSLSLPVSLVVVVHLSRRRITEAQAVAAGAATLGLGVLALALRGGPGERGPLGVVGILSLTLDGFDFLVNALDPGIPLAWGRSIVEDGVLTYLPRALWAGKPEAFGAVDLQESVLPGLLADVGGTTSTYPVGLLAEGYLNFGVVGIFMLPWLLGIAIRRIRDMARRDHSPFWVILISWLVPNQLGMLRGLGQMLASSAVVVVLLSPLLLSRRRR